MINLLYVPAQYRAFYLNLADTGLVIQALLKKIQKLSDNPLPRMQGYIKAFGGDQVESATLIVSRASCVLYNIKGR